MGNEKWKLWFYDFCGNDFRELSSLHIASVRCAASNGRSLVHRAWKHEKFVFVIRLWSDFFLPSRSQNRPCSGDFRLGEGVRWYVYVRLFYCIWSKYHEKIFRGWREKWIFIFHERWNMQIVILRFLRKWLSGTLIARYCLSEVCSV